MLRNLLRLIRLSISSRIAEYEFGRMTAMQASSEDMGNTMTVRQIERMTELSEKMSRNQMMSAALAQQQQAGDRNNMDPNREVAIAGGGTVKVKDIPIDPKTGYPTEEWAIENCTCEVHTKMREQRGQQQSGTGQYL